MAQLFRCASKSTILIFFTKSLKTAKKMNDKKIFKEFSSFSKKITLE